MFCTQIKISLHLSQTTVAHDKKTSHYYKVYHKHLWEKKPTLHNMSKIIHLSLFD